ncbi:MAG TPA: RdgB/HAM1 family non-canonical purine NTP pyrophosphatase [Patescibacteria group bacterium]|nr:RdgB/HAM1 family non-canonical purine NTP pyrophosphatase [Patescibacteria group bacterium]
MKKLLVATHNAGKKKEIQDILSDLSYVVLMLDDIENKIQLPEEMGATYEENALIKARFAGESSQLLTMADDSGLEVSALPGELGVRTARYAPGADADRNIKLLVAMKDVRDRKARFISCITLYDPTTKQTQVFIGEMGGTISEESKGTNGFGFDPVFIPEGYTQTFAELGATVKNEISHRAKALRQLKRALETV